MLKRLRIKNFKCWSDTGEMRFAPITAFFGANNSGKTSIAQLLLMLKQTVDSPYSNQPLHLGDARSLVELGTLPEIMHNHDPQNLLGWEMGWDPWPRRPGTRRPELLGHGAAIRLSGKEIRHSAEIGLLGAGKSTAHAIVKKMGYRFDENRFELRLSENRNGGEHILDARDERGGKIEQSNPRDLSERGSRKIHNPFKCYGFASLGRSHFEDMGHLWEFESSFETFFSRVYYLGPLRDTPRRHYSWSGTEPTDMGRKGERAVDAMLTSQEKNRRYSLNGGRKDKTLEEVIAYWLKELRLSSSLKVRRFTPKENLFHLRLRRERGEPEVLVTDIGFGVSQVLPVIALCHIVPDGSTLILEQPELHLHPAAQSGLADMLIHAVKTKKIQVIVESHSEHMLLRMQRRIAEGIFPHDDASLFFCRSARGSSVLDPLDMDEYGMIRNWPEAFFGDDFTEIAEMNKAMHRRKLRA